MPAPNLSRPRANGGFATGSTLRTYAAGWPNSEPLLLDETKSAISCSTTKGESNSRRASSGFVLTTTGRLRRSHWKGPRQPGPYKTRVELEVEVSDGMTLLALLHALGFTPSSQSLAIAYAPGRFRSGLRRQIVPGTINHLSDRFSWKRAREQEALYDVAVQVPQL